MGEELAIESPRSSQEDHLINLLRATAAILVCIAHARALLVINYDESSKSLVQKVLFALTGLGKEAVIVFFVLSGFWVGGGVVRTLSRGTFDPARYTIDRIVRLMTVLLPCLVLVLALDAIGMMLFPQASAYVGNHLYHGPGFVPPASHGPGIFFGNLLFLQGLFVLPYGSDTSLWSISYEFWMYMAGPFVIALALRRSVKAAFATAAALVVAGLLGTILLVYLPTWLLGAAIAAYADRIRAFAQRLPYPWILLARIFCLALLLGCSVIARNDDGSYSIAMIYLVAVPAALLLITVIAQPAWERASNRLAFASWLASSSYSLYAIHVPVLIFFTAAMGIDAEARWSASLAGWLTLTMTTIGMILVAWIFAQLTERHTGAIRSIAHNWLKLSRRCARQEPQPYSTVDRRS